MEEILGMTGLERYKCIQRVAYLLLPLPRARRFLTGHLNEFNVRTMQGAALLHFSVTDGQSLSLSIVLLIAVSDTPRWVTSRQSAQLGVVEIFLVNSACRQFDTLPRNRVHIQLPEEVTCYGIWCTYSFLRKSHVTEYGAHTAS
jgi:hypothetical protein